MRQPWWFLLSMILGISAGTRAWALPSELCVEFDLDGTPGNGSDETDIVIGEPLLVDVWVHPNGCELWVFGLWVCWSGTSMVFDSCSYYLPVNWEAQEPVTMGGCTIIGGLMGPPAYVPVSVSTKVATLEFHGVAASDADTVCVDSGGWDCDCLDFDDCGLGQAICPAVHVSGGTGTEESAWGAIKTLFR